MLRILNKKLLYSEPVPFWEWSMRHNNAYNLPEIFLDMPFFIRNKLAVPNLFNGLTASKFLFNFKLPRRRRNINLFLFSYIYTIYKRIFYYRRVLRFLLVFVNLWIQSFLNKELSVLEKLLVFLNKKKLSSVFLLLRYQVKKIFSTYGEVLESLIKTIQRIYRRKLFKLRYLALYYIGINELTSTKRRKILRVVRYLFEFKTRIYRSTGFFLRKVMNLFTSSSKKNFRHYSNKRITQPLVRDAHVNDTFYLYVLENFLISKYNITIKELVYLIKKHKFTNWDTLFYQLESTLPHIQVDVVKLCVAVWLTVRTQMNTNSLQLKYLTSLFFCTLERTLAKMAKKFRTKHINSFNTIHSLISSSIIISPTLDITVRDFFVRNTNRLHRNVFTTLLKKTAAIKELVIRSHFYNKGRSLKANKTIGRQGKEWLTYFRRLKQIARTRKKNVLLFFLKQEKAIKGLLYPTQQQKARKINKIFRRFMVFLRSRGTQEVLRYSYAYADYYKDTQYEWIYSNKLLLANDSLQNKYCTTNLLKRQVAMPIWSYLYLYQYIEDGFIKLVNNISYKNYTMYIPKSSDSTYLYLKKLLSTGSLNYPKSPAAFTQEVRTRHKNEFLSRIVKKNEKLRYNKMNLSKLSS